MLINNNMTTEKQSEKPVRGKNGGARPGAGRPKGSTHKLTVSTLLEELRAAGLPFEKALVNNYINAQGDPRLAFQYDQLFMGKVFATLNHVEVEDGMDNLEAKAQAFATALKDLVESGTVEPPDPQQD
jgi:hypothetical protein